MPEFKSKPDWEGPIPFKLAGALATPIRKGGMAERAPLDTAEPSIWGTTGAPLESIMNGMLPGPYGGGGHGKVEAAASQLYP